MKTDDLKLIFKFLDKNYRLFMEFISSEKVDVNEAAAIIEMLELEVDPKGKRDVKQTKIETDDLPSVAEVSEWMGLRKELREWMLLNFPDDFSKDNLVYTRDIIEVIKKKLKRGKK